ncbi:MAG: hypothetical protein GXO74_12205 [Calditrichaeota bacterium]|nr:hypothetical protein [Calditrichota bacterium]
MNLTLNKQTTDILAYLLNQRVADLNLMIRHSHLHTCKAQLKQQKQIIRELLQRLESEK